MQKVYFGQPSDFQRGWIDIGWKEMTAAAPLVLLILWIGIYPAPLLKQIEPATHIEESK
jgi:NADH-quinone oxidoreductase subunit M